MFSLRKRSVRNNQYSINVGSNFKFNYVQKIYVYTRSVIRVCY